MDRDNDGIADLQDPFPTIPQKVIYAGIAIFFIILLVMFGVFAKSRSKKKFSANFYDNLNLQITPEKESYEVGSTVNFIVSISNNIGDIVSGKIESNLFKTIELTRIRKGETYRKKVTTKSNNVGALIETAKATIIDEIGKKHIVEKSFEVEIIPPRPKLELELRQEKVVKPHIQSSLTLSIRNIGKGNAENISLEVQAENGVEIGEYSSPNSIDSNSLAKVQIPYTCLNIREFAVKVIAKYSNGKQYSDYATITLKTLPFKPEGKIELTEIPQSLKVSESMQGTLSIINVGEDAMLNVNPKIEGLDISIPVFSRIDPKKEVVYPIKFSFDSSGTKALKVIVEYEDEIGKKYSISEERTIMVKGLQLKPSINIEIPTLIAGEIGNCKVIVANMGEELIKDATLELLVDGTLTESKTIGDLTPRDRKSLEIPIEPKGTQRIEVIANLKYKDLLGKEYTYQERASGTLKERTVFVTSAANYQGTWILYKVKVENKLPKPISDIKIKLFVPDVFLIKESEKTISMLEPNNARTVTFEIRPTGECGECTVSGRITYYNYLTDRREELDIPIKSVSIICPLLKVKEIREEEWRKLTSNLIKAEDTTKEEIPLSAKSLFNMVSDIIKDMNLYMLSPSITEDEKFFRGVAKFYGEGVKELKYGAQIEVIGGTKKSQLILKSWAEREDALTGFYYKILDEIEKRVKIKEYIDDSIVQYNITTIKDSVVQRSQIGR